MFSVDGRSHDFLCPYRSSFIYSASLLPLCHNSFIFSFISQCFCATLLLEKEFLFLLISVLVYYLVLLKKIYVLSPVFIVYFCGKENYTTSKSFEVLKFFLIHPEFELESCADWVEPETLHGPGILDLNPTEDFKFFCEILLRFAYFFDNTKYKSEYKIMKG